jgi:hypothetical protein
VALFLALGLVACGGSSDSSSSSASTEATQTQAEGKPSETSAKQGGEKSKQGSGGKSKSGESQPKGPPASAFVPQQHSDSGGGSDKLRTKGGDNSVQEFGEENSSEFEAAATALHNFLDARAEGNWAAACEYMSAGIVESFKQLAPQGGQAKDTSCAGILVALTNPAAKPALKAEAEKADARSLRTEGERAFLIYTGLEGTIFAMPMANEDGTWLVASLAGTPLN